MNKKASYYKEAFLLPEINFNVFEGNLKGTTKRIESEHPDGVLIIRSVKIADGLLQVGCEVHHRNTGTTSC